MFVVITMHLSAYTHIHAHTHIHTYTHTYTHTHTHTHSYTVLYYAYGKFVLLSHNYYGTRKNSHVIGCSLLVLV